MRQKLEAPLVDLLTIRIELNRSLRVFGRKELSQGFGISISTLDRYASPPMRELSRVVSKRQTMRKKGIDTTHCAYCPLLISHHPRCEECTILLHGEQCHCIDSAYTRKMMDMRNQEFGVITVN